MPYVIKPLFRLTEDQQQLIVTKQRTKVGYHILLTRLIKAIMKSEPNHYHWVHYSLSRSNNGSIDDSKHTVILWIAELPQNPSDCEFADISFRALTASLAYRQLIQTIYERID